MTITNLLKNLAKAAEDIVRASYAVSKKVAEYSKLVSDGEFVKECLIKLTNILYPEQREKFTEVSLSRKQPQDE